MFTYIPQMGGFECLICFVEVLTVQIPDLQGDFLWNCFEKFKKRKTSRHQHQGFCAGAGRLAPQHQRDRPAAVPRGAGAVV